MFAKVVYATNKIIIKRDKQVVTKMLVEKNLLKQKCLNG